MANGVMPVLLGLQVFQVAFLFLHDWVPLGGLNDVRAQRVNDSFAKRIITTVVSGAPFLLLLVKSTRWSVQGSVPHALLIWL